MTDIRVRNPGKYRAPSNLACDGWDMVKELFELAGTRGSDCGASWIACGMYRSYRTLIRIVGVVATVAGSLAAGAALAQDQPAASPPPPLQQVTNSADIVRLVQTWVSQNHVFLWLAYLAIAGVVGLGLYRFRTTELAAKLRRTLEDEVLTNWRLTVLGITSLALTLASGWTTWDGMTNFTGTPLLSFLITLGIQGVMLIAAWLIGESFAIGLAGSGASQSRSWSDFFFKFVLSGEGVLALLSVLLLAGAFYAVTMAGTYHGTIEAIDGILRRHKSELALPIPTENLRVLIAVGISALLTLLIVTQNEVFEPYFRGIKTILKSLPIWLMFLSCMITSVFFSFDSLFSTIFPQSERERAAQLRTTNQVAGIVADLGATITKRQADSIDGLFTSAQWTEYSARINDIIAIARGAPDQIAAQARKELEDQQSQRAGFQERKASAQSQQVRLDKRKEELLGDVNKLKEEVPPLAAEVDRLKGEIFKKDSEILAKKSEAQAEAGGVGGTLKAGQGPVYAERKKEMDDLAKLKAILDSQLTDRAAQLKDKRDKVASAEAELAQIDGEIGKLKGEMDVADKQMATAAAPKPEGSLSATTQNIAVTGFNSLEDAFAQFRQHPERANFDAIQQQCAALLSVFDKVPSIKPTADAKGVRCDPSVVAEPVTRILALNDGLAAYKARCAKPDSLPQTSVDDLISFGQQCVQSSGLGGQDTVAYRSQINSIGLNRDDKAHRFVVSWNAFLDGNRLAYLALLIAIALDGLVFMSGLFGANATSSPLVRLPNAASRSASDLEATMYAALRPDIYGRAKLIINALHPIQPKDGFVSEIRLGDYDRETGAAMRSVLSMAAQFGAVGPDPRQPGVYLVRGELTEFLSKACERELRINPKVQQAAEAARIEEAQRHLRYEQERQGEVENERKSTVVAQKDSVEQQRRAKALEPILTAALVPDHINDKELLFHRASLVLAHIRPGSANDVFTHRLDIAELPPGVIELFRGVLNSASTLRAVQHDGDVNNAGAERYLIKPEVVLCLTNIRVAAAQEAERLREREARSWFRGRIGKSKPEAARMALPSQTPFDPKSRLDLGLNGGANGHDAYTRQRPPPGAPAKTPLIAAPSISTTRERASASSQLHDYVYELGSYFELEPAERDTILAMTQKRWAGEITSMFHQLAGVGDLDSLMASAANDAERDFASFDEMVQRRKIDLTGVNPGQVAASFAVLRQLAVLSEYIDGGGMAQSVPPQALSNLQRDVTEFVSRADKSLAALQSAMSAIVIGPGASGPQRLSGLN